MSFDVAVNVLLTALTLTVDATTIMLIAWVVILANRKRSSVRHAVWVAAFAALLLLPVLTLGRQAGKTIPIKVPGEAPVARVLPPPPGLKWNPTRSEPAAAISVPEPHISAPKELPRFPQLKPAPKPQSPDYPGVARKLMFVWLAGAGVIFLWIAVAVQGLRSLFRSSVPIPWRNGEFEGLSSHYKLRRPVALRMARPGLEISAMTWGFYRPVILLPSNAETWSDRERASILLHELAHVHRRDSLYQLLSTIATAVFWFHPVVWLASWAMRAEAENAADDAVIRSGVRATDYASQLLALAAQYGETRRTRLSLGVFMIKKSGMEKRLRSIVDPKRRRQDATMSQIVSIALVAVTGVFLLTNIRPILKAGAESHDRFFDADLYSATKHQRDPERHKMAMLKQWHPGMLANHSAEALRVADQSTNEASGSGPIQLNEAAIRPAHRPFTMQRMQRVATVHAVPRVDCVQPLSPIAKPKPPVKPVALSVPWSRAVTVSSTLEAPVNEAVETEKDGGGDVETANLPSEKRPIPRFHAVIASSDITLTVRVGKGEHCSVSAPGMGELVSSSSGKLEFSGSHREDIEMTASIEDGVLHLSGSGLTGIVVTAPALDRLEANGHSTVRCIGITSNRNVTILASGGSTVDVSGRSSDLMLDLSGGSTVRAHDMAASRLKVAMSGSAVLEVSGAFSQTVLHAEGGCSLRVFGHTDQLILTGQGGSSVDCSGFGATDVVVSADGASSVRISASKSLAATAKSSSQIQYLGHPGKVKTSPDESSKIYS